jgi:hypothetical protein
MIVTRLLTAVGETQETEYPDFDQALLDLRDGDFDLLNYTLFELDLETGRIDRSLNSKELKATVDELRSQSA